MASFNIFFLLYIINIILSLIQCCSNSIITKYNFGNEQDPEIDKSYNHLLGRNIYFVEESENKRTMYITIIYPSLTLEVQLKMYTDSTELIDAFNEGKKIYFGFDLMIENIDIKVENYNESRTDAMICFFDKNDVNCHDYIYNKTQEKYLLNDDGIILRNNLIPLGFSNINLNFIQENVKEYKNYFSVYFEKKYPPLFDNITMFTWMSYVGSNTGEGVIGFYGIMKSDMDLNAIPIDKSIYYKKQDFFDGSGLPNKSIFLNFNLINFFLFIFLCNL